MVDCDWPNDAEVVYSTIRQQQQEGELNILDRKTGQSRVVATLPDATSCCTGILEVVEGKPVAVTQFVVNQGTNTLWSQPAT